MVSIRSQKLKYLGVKCKPPAPSIDGCLTEPPASHAAGRRPQVAAIRLITLYVAGQCFRNQMA